MKSLNDAILKANDRDAIRAAAEILRSSFPVERIVLFGSKARGDDAPASDIDLLVLTRRTLTWQERDQLIDSVFDLQLDLNVVISLLVVPTEQWEDEKYRILPIHSEIERDGIAA